MLKVSITRPTVKPLIFMFQGKTVRARNICQYIITCFLLFFIPKQNSFHYAAKQIYSECRDSMLIIYHKIKIKQTKCVRPFHLKVDTNVYGVNVTNSIYPVILFCDPLKPHYTLVTHGSRCV